MGWITNLAGAAAFVAFTLWYYIHVPSDLPKNIPNIPIYVSLLGLWSDMGQDEIYERWLREPLEKYGAVKIWFAGRWSILFTRAEYMTEMFRNEHVYAKAGSQKKIPWSVIASLVGDNIINSHGDDWKLYTDIMKPGMQKRGWDASLMIGDTQKFVKMMLELQDEAPQGGGVVVNPLIQRWAIQLMGRSFIDTDLKCLENPDVRLEVLQSIIKRTLFKPLFFNFPTLDKYSFFFRSRITAYNIMQEFGDRLFKVGRSRPRKVIEKGVRDDQDIQVVHLLNSALDAKRIDEKQYRDNIKITFLTAHENAQQLLNSAFWELGKNQRVQDELRSEVLSTGDVDPTADVVNRMPYLTSVLYELLRLYPPVSQLINRVTTDNTTMGGRIAIPKRTWVGWNAYGAHVDTANWGKDAYEFVPGRWGSTVEQMQSKFRQDCVSGKYIPFNAHSRKCLGQGFAILEMKIVLFELVKRTKWTIHPDYKLKLTSGGILAPLGCKVVFESTPSSANEKVANGHAH